MDDLLQWLTDIKDKKVLDNRTLIETTRYRGFAFWWFLRSRLYRDLRMVFDSKTKRYHRSIRKFIISKLDFLYYFYLLFIVLISKLLFSFFPRRSTGRRRILLTGQFNAWKTIRDAKTGAIGKGHLIFDPIQKKMNREYPSFDFLSSCPFGFSFHRHLKHALEMRRSISFDHFATLENYFTMKSLLRVLSARRRFANFWNEMDKLMPKGDLTFRRINIFEVFKDLLKYYYKLYLPIMVLYFELALHLLDIEKPAIVLLSNEAGGFERALLYATTYQGLPSLAIQHGIIHEHHPGYIYAKGDVSTQALAKFPYVPLPTRTAVFGTYYEEILTKVSNYPTSSIVVTGQPRYDALKSVDEIYSRKAFCARYGLDCRKKIVLIITQPFVERIRSEFFVHTIRVLKGLAGIQIIVKPHQIEAPEWHCNALSELEAEAIVLSPNADTYEAIYSCDLFIAINSTTILEALILDKVVIAVNLSNLPELIPWVTAGAVLGVYETSTLASTIADALFNETKIRQKLVNRFNFLVSQFYKLDGQASDRVIKLMLNLIEVARPNSDFDASSVEDE